MKKIRFFMNNRLLVATLALGLLLASSISLADPETGTAATATPEPIPANKPTGKQPRDDAAENEAPVDDPAFNPSEEISEDLSVPFPVDI